MIQKDIIACRFGCRILTGQYPAVKTDFAFRKPVVPDHLRRDAEDYGIIGDAGAHG